MDFSIRPLEPGDGVALNKMIVLEGVFETLNTLPSKRPDDVTWLERLGPRHHAFVAEEKGDRTLVGFALLQEYPGRRRHAGTVGIYVHKDYQRKGAGRALFAKLLDLADNWLMLERLELRVFAGNDHAIRMYKSFGFVEEGVIRHGAIQNGAYADERNMARFRPAEGAV